MNMPPTPDELNNALHDFDFLYGYWHVEHKKLASRLTDCTEWESFSSTQHCWPLLGGLCNVDEAQRINAASGAGYVGTALRCLNSQTQQWSIYWVGASDGVLQLPPVVGGFSDGVGIFDADEMINDRMTRVRFTWSGISSSTAHWQQAFSLDQGASWEINWTMAFTRINAAQHAADLHL